MFIRKIKNFKDGKYISELSIETNGNRYSFKGILLFENLYMYNCS